MNLPTKAEQRTNSIANCLAVLNNLLPYVTTLEGQQAAFGGYKDGTPVVDDKGLKVYAKNTGIKALMRLNQILDEDGLWDGKDIEAYRRRIGKHNDAQAAVMMQQCLPRTSHKPDLLKENGIWVAKFMAGKDEIVGKGQTPEQALCDYDRVFLKGAEGFFNQR